MEETRGLTGIQVEPDGCILLSLGGEVVRTAFDAVDPHAGQLRL